MCLWFHEYKCTSVLACLCTTCVCAWMLWCTSYVCVYMCTLLHLRGLMLHVCECISACTCEMRVCGLACVHVSACVCTLARVCTHKLEVSSLTCRGGQALPGNILQACYQMGTLSLRAGLAFPGEEGMSPTPLLSPVGALGAVRGISRACLPQLRG